MKFIRYLSTGRIIGYGEMSAEGMAHLAAESADLFMEGDGRPDTHYVLAGVITARPAMTFTIAGNVISGLPTPCKARHDFVDYTITDGVIDFTSDTAGPHVITITAFPYLDTTITLP